MSLANLIATGSKVWSDGIDPQEIAEQRPWGITGATSNPVIISDLIKTGRFDDEMGKLFDDGFTDAEVAWQLTDHLVSEAQEVFRPVWDQTGGNDGYVSFELDPLLEDENGPPVQDRTRHYVTLAERWSQDQVNRMIKVPATEAGLAALEQIAALGVTINVTLIFTDRQYAAARDAIWRGAQRRRDGLERFKSVYSIFISRIDVYTSKHVPELSKDAQGQVGIVNAKRVWQHNQDFWAEKRTPLEQEIVFASTGTKLEGDPPDRYPAALAGDGILTNPPETNRAVQESGKPYQRTVDRMPPQAVLDEIDRKVDVARMEQVLMSEGVTKFAKPQHALMKLIKEKRAQLAGAQ